jgi:predicted PurR-regulated permease PerM
MTDASRADDELGMALPRGTLILLSGAAAVICVAGIRSFNNTLGPVFLALMVVVGVDPLMGWLIRRRVPRVLAAVATLLVAYAIIIGLAVALALAAAQLATTLPQYTDEFNDLVDQAEAFLADRGVGQDQVQEALSAFDFGQLITLVQAVLTGLLGVFSSLVFILALLLFMVMDAATFNDKLDRAERIRPEVVGAFRGFASGTRRYLIVSTVFGLIVAVFDTIALAWLGVPLAVLWGLLSFITNYIPNIGFVIGLIPPAILALLEGGWVDALAVVIVYSVINFVIQSLIQPKFVGDAVGLSVTLTFLSLVFWSFAMGALGALLAIPLTLLAKALLIDIDPRLRWVNGLITAGRPRDDKPFGEADPSDVTQQRIAEVIERSGGDERISDDVEATEQEGAPPGEVAAERSPPGRR